MYEKGREKWENQKKRMDKNKAPWQIIDTAFRLFVEKKIEAVSMDEVAKEAGVGRATLFRCYNNKTELAIAVCASKWKAYLDKLDEARPISSIHDIPAIGRFIFTLDSYIGMYQNHKDLLQYNDNFNNYITHQTVRQEELAGSTHPGPVAYKDFILSGMRRQKRTRPSARIFRRNSSCE